MSTQPHIDSVWTELIDALTDATRLVATAHRQATNEEGNLGFLAGVKRQLDKWATEQPAAAAEDELERLGGRLSRLHAWLDDVAGAQLERDVNLVVKFVEGQVVRHRAALDQPVRHRDARRVGASLLGDVQKALSTIIPAGPAPRPGGDPSPPGSLLTPAASAFARGQSLGGRVVANLDARAIRWWNARINRDGIEATLPEIRAQAGGDPLEAAWLANRFLGGVLLGTKLDPESRKPVGPAVVDPTHTTVAIGASGVGKTSGLVGPYAALRAARGDNVVVVTPQSPTIELILPTAKALSGQEHVPVVDFGGEIVGRDSPEFCAWDVTRNCLTTEGAMEFADAFAGPKLPARAQLSNPEYWGGIVWDMYGAAGHIAAGMRELRGLDPHGLNGMARVYDLLRSPGPGDVPNALPEVVRAALAGDPARLQGQEALFREAQAYAERFNPRLQRIAFQEHILKAAGVPLSDEIVGEKLESLSAALDFVGKSKQGDPMETLLTTFKRAVPPHERLVMSPRPGDNEIDPKDLVRPGAGVSFVAYAHTGTTGLAAGAFTSQILDAAILQNKDVGMLRSMGGTGRPARLSLVVDEGNAGRYIPRLPDVVTDTRQLGISALVSMTSEHHLRSVFGEDDAGKFLHAPCVIDLTPDALKSAEIAPLFGQHVVERRSEASGPGVGSVTWAEQKENILEASDINRLPRGQAVVKYPSDPTGDRLKIVQLSQFNDPSTVVGSAADHVRRHPEEFEPMPELLERFRPDLSQMRAVQSDPTAPLMEGSAESVAAALADPGEDPVSVPEVPAEPEPEPEPVKPAVAEVPDEAPAAPPAVEVEDGRSKM